MGRKIPRLRSKGSQDGGGERSLGRGPAQRRAWRVCARRGPPTVPKDEPCPRHCSREYPSSSSGEVGWPRRASRLGPQRRRPSAAAAGAAAVQRHREGPRQHGPTRRPPSSSRRAAPRRREDRTCASRRPRPRPPLSRARPLPSPAWDTPPAPPPQAGGPSGSASLPSVAYQAPPRPISSSPHLLKPRLLRHLGPAPPQGFLEMVRLRLSPGAGSDPSARLHFPPEADVFLSNAQARSKNSLRASRLLKQRLTRPHVFACEMN